MEQEKSPATRAAATSPSVAMPGRLVLSLHRSLARRTAAEQRTDWPAPRRRSPARSRPHRRPRAPPVTAMSCVSSTSGHGRRFLSSSPAIPAWAESGPEEAATQLGLHSFPRKVMGSRQRGTGTGCTTRSPSRTGSARCGELVVVDVAVLVESALVGEVDAGRLLGMDEGFGGPPGCRRPACPITAGSEPVRLWSSWRYISGRRRGADATSLTSPRETASPVAGSLKRHR